MRKAIDKKRNSFFNSKGSLMPNNAILRIRPIIMQERKIIELGHTAYKPELAQRTPLHIVKKHVLQG